MLSSELRCPRCGAGLTVQLLDGEGPIRVGDWVFYPGRVEFLGTEILAITDGE